MLLGLTEGQVLPIAMKSLPWSLPLVLGGAAWKLFAFIDANASAEARSKLAAYIKGKEYREHFLALPALAGSAINKVFGVDHWAIKCLFRSVFVSILSILGFFAFSFIYNQGAIVEGVKIIAALGTRKVLPFCLVWLIWACILDYLNLFKTRVVLAILEKFNLSLRALAAVALLDFMFGAGIFLAGMSFFLATASLAHTYHVGKITNGFGAAFGADIVLTAGLFVLSILLAGVNGALFYVIPIADLLWASLLPSIWLWFYVACVLLTRFLLSFDVVFARLVWLLNVDDHPFKIVGLLASSGIGSLMFILLALRAFVTT